MSDYRIVATAAGGPEVMAVAPLDDGPVAAGMVRVRHRAIGVNFIDVYHRNGLYKQPLPTGLGVEAAGVVEGLGDGVAGVKPGDRVGYVVATPGAYATRNDVPADTLIALPDAVSDELAAASLLKGLTVESLINSVAGIETGQSALVTAAAGGIGRLMVQWLAAIGVRVIAHAGSSEKASIAKGLGAQEALHDPFEALAAMVRAATGGKGVDVVFDGVGGASWTASLDSLRPRGHMISFGNASGPVPPISLLDLASRGSLTLTRPRLFDYIADPAERERGTAALFDMLAKRRIDVVIGLSAPLKDAAEVHRALEGRKTTGSVILIP